MSTFKQSIIQSFKGASNTFQTFPVAIASALAFAIVTVVRIRMDWSDQIDYNFLFNCLHLAFATSAAFGLMIITAVQSRLNTTKAFLMANLLGVVVALFTFLMLYFFGGSDESLMNGVVTNVSSISAARITSIISVCIIAFVYFAGYPKEQSDFSRSLFMMFKAFVIATIYGLVIMGGTSGVAGATESLLYQNMSSKVYMYLGTITGFLAFTIFVGYFPDFRKDAVDERREVAQKQPRFMAVLLEYIMIPIVLALTVVLLSWTGKTVITGSWPAFTQVSGIVISYAMGGILLHLMVTHISTSLAKVYKKVYPIAALVILAFGLWAFVIQLTETGLKTQEYFFALIWFVAITSSVLLLVKKDKAHQVIAALVCVMMIVSVLPLVNYHVLPVRAQVSRLESLLEDEGILKNGQLTPASVEPELEIREAITDAVEYLAYEEDADLPSWFDEQLGNRDVFEATLGFEQTWVRSDDYYDPRYDESMGTSLLLHNEAVDISDYQWAVYLNDYRGNIDGPAGVTLDGKRGVYEVNWTFDSQFGIPILKILLDDQVILEHNLKEFLDNTAETFQSGQKKFYEETFEDMILELEIPELSILLVFNNIDIEINPRYDTIYYYIDLNVLYLKEK